MAASVRDGAKESSYLLDLNGFRALVMFLVFIVSVMGPLLTAEFASLVGRAAEVRGLKYHYLYADDLPFCTVYCGSLRKVCVDITPEKLPCITAHRIKTAGKRHLFDIRQPVCQI